MPNPSLFRPDVVAVDLSRFIKELAEKVESPATAQAAAEAMEREFTIVAKGAMGGDLKLSGLHAGPTVIKAESSGGEAELQIRNITLTDKGRRRATRAKARGRALATPFGPRASVAGSTTQGKDVLDRGSESTFAAGIKAAMSQLERR